MLINRSYKPDILSNSATAREHRVHPSPSMAIEFISTKWFPRILIRLTVGASILFSNLFTNFGVILLNRIKYVDICCIM